jgi:hypothetical protein
MTIKSMITNKTCHNDTGRKGHKITGIALSIIGFFWLAKKIGWIPVAAGGSTIFWPIVTITVGIVLFLSVRRHHKSCDTDNLPQRHN